MGESQGNQGLSAISIAKSLLLITVGDSAIKLSGKTGASQFVSGCTPEDHPRTMASYASSLHRYGRFTGSVLASMTLGESGVPESVSDFVELTYGNRHPENIARC